MTVLLLVFFTIPLINIIKFALNPRELEVKIQNENTILQTRLDAVESKVMMGGNDKQVLKKLKKEVGALKQEMASKEIEYRNLKEQVACTERVLEVLKINSEAGKTSKLETCYKFSGLVFYILGSIGSVVAGAMFVLSWWRSLRVPSSSI